jgi:hypothetical protein
MVYEGFWKKGQIHGKGTMKEPNGKKFSGEWETGKLIEKFEDLE